MDTNIILEDMEAIYLSRKDWSQFADRTILISGAYGMLASYLVYFFMYLHEKKSINVKIIALVKSQQKFKKRFGNIENYMKIYELSLESEVKIQEEIDYIIHAASLASPQYYEVCPVDVLMPNTIGTYNLLMLAKKKQAKSFLLFSTGDIYGRIDGKERINENDYGYMDTLDIHNCYGESKRMAETMCMAFWRQYDVPIKIARIWHTYSPTMDIKNDPRVFASFVNNVVNEENIIMKSDGSGRRSFCYITDAISGYLTILLDGENGEAYNVCNESQNVSILELARILVSLCPDRKIKVEKCMRDSAEHYTENILLKDSMCIPSSQKLQKLGWCAKVDVKTGFDRVIRFFK